jgi:tetratricopeptide (TPR) repeat protein
MVNDSNMPDFDSMSPEELMEWMETLARRQGVAEEELTTSARADIAEVRAEDVDVGSLGEYIPYGWTREKWEAHQAQEAAEQAAQAARQALFEPSADTQATPVPPITPAFRQVDDEFEVWDLPEPRGERVDHASVTEALAAMPEPEYANDAGMADEDGLDYEPAYDVDGFTTDGLDSDADDVIYADALADDDFRDNTAELLEAVDSLVEQTPSPRPPEADLPAAEQEPPPAERQSALRWLEDMSQVDDELPLPDFRQLEQSAEELASIDLDFSLDLTEEASEQDAMAWLESISAGDFAEDGTAAEAAFDPEPDDRPRSAPRTSTDPISWLETLARRQGALEKELTTTADSASLPLPETAASDAPGYRDYRVSGGDDGRAATEAPAASQQPPRDSDDPQTWLDSLASGVLDDARTDVAAALSQGEPVAPEAMEAYLGQHLDEAIRLNADETALDDAEPDEPEPATIPDWLRSQMDTQTMAAARPIDDDAIADIVDSATVGEIDKLDTSELDALLDEDSSLEDAVAETSEKITDELRATGVMGATNNRDEPPLPEWLMAEDDTTADLDSIDSIFADASGTAGFIDDVNDPWVQALGDENDGREVIEAWYEAEAAAFDEEAMVADRRYQPELPVSEYDETDELPFIRLPEETGVPAGEPAPMPDWLAEEEPPVVGVAPEGIRTEGVAGTVLPEWLVLAETQSVGPEDADTPVPEWLLETQPEPAAPPPTPAAAPAPRPVASASPAPAPTPVPAASAAADMAGASIDTVLASARGHLEAGNIDAALKAYEVAVRANRGLDAVEAALRELLEDRELRRNPGVYRVLGDVRMRQGKLQEALDTYRRALNLL